MTRLLTLVFVLYASTSALAQELIIASKGAPGSRVGLAGSVHTWYDSVPPEDISVTISTMRRDIFTNEDFVDLATSEKFGRCKSEKGLNCVRKDSTYQITLDALPEGNEYGYGTEYDVRAEAPGFYHVIWDVRRVYAYPGSTVHVDTIYMHESGTKLRDPLIWWIDKTSFAVGAWVKSEWVDKINVDYVFSGSSLTVAKAEYGALSFQKELGTDWTWVSEKGFTLSKPPDSEIGAHSGSICVKVQLRSTASNDWVEAPKEACMSARPATNYPSIK